MLTWWLPGCSYEVAPLDWLVGVVIGLFMLGNFPCSCCLLTFFKNLHFHVIFKKKIRNTVRVSNGLDSYQDRLSFGPDQVPNGLQMILSRQQKSPLASKELMSLSTISGLAGNQKEV